MPPRHYERLHRLCSHVATELIRLYQTNANDKASSLTDSVLRGLKRPDTHKETTLLVLGHISKYVRKRSIPDDCSPGKELLWVMF